MRGIGLLRHSSGALDRQINSRHFARENEFLTGSMHPKDGRSLGSMTSIFGLDGMFEAVKSDT